MTRSNSSVAHLSRMFSTGMVSVLFLCAATSNGSTTVYKIKNPDGSVSYSDQPQDNAEVMQVEPVPTIPAIPVNRDAPDASAEPVESGLAYSIFQIKSPVNGSAFPSPEGSVEVNVVIEPSLHGDHTFEYWLNGTMKQSSQSTALELSDIERGTHTLQVRIIDSSGKAIDSRTSSFTVHRPMVKRP